MRSMILSGISAKTVAIAFSGILQFLKAIVEDGHEEGPVSETRWNTAKLVILQTLHLSIIP